MLVAMMGALAWPIIAFAWPALPDRGWGLARTLGLPNWDKPSMACLASRIPFGTPITDGLEIRLKGEGVIPIEKPKFRRGDANSDGNIDVSDIIYLINYLFKGGPLPVPLIAGDSNNDEEVTVSDVIYLINYLFKGGPKPEC